MTSSQDDAQPVGTNAYSAAPAALGYLAQVEYALLLALQRLNHVLDFDITLETLDDIVFHEGVSAVEQLQAKHRVDRTASLTDGSTDIWKTLHNWIVSSTTEATLTLLTNATASEGTAAARLRMGADRDVAAAHASLVRFARNSENKAHASYYKAFLELGQAERLALLERVTILDGRPAIADLDDELQLAVRKATMPKFRTALIERLRGWWVAKVHDHLTRIALGEADRIASVELEEQLLGIAETLRDDDLPIDFYDMVEPTTGEASADGRAFVEQLRLISLGNARLRQCIFDHNRAFAQRSKWQREQLLHVGELKRYEDRLRDEWKRHCLPLTDDETSDEDVELGAARDRFLALERSALPRIRANVAEPYVANGSVHMLADRLEIGWHPAWLEEMMKLFPELLQSGEGAA